jgi:hypothetical protein
MPVIVKYDGRIIETRMIGRIAGPELLSQLREMVVIEEREPVTPDRIIDLRETDTSEIKFNDVFAIAERRRLENLKNPIKSAFVAKTNVQYGIARTFQSLNDNPQISIRVFREESEARAWLAEGDDPAA